MIPLMSPRAEAVPTCLCVELDPDFFYLIQSYAGRCGMRALHVPRGADALAVARQEKPTLICLEPEHHADQSPWEVLRNLKTQADTATVPVILFSWLDEEEKARQAGAAVYARKPVMYVDFLEALAQAGVRVKNQEKTSP
jgi:DNA-binding response OmpR family regulator